MGRALRCLPALTASYQKHYQLPIERSLMMAAAAKAAKPLGPQAMVLAASAAAEAKTNPAAACTPGSTMPVEPPADSATPAGQHDSNQLQSQGQGEADMHALPPGAKQAEANRSGPPLASCPADEVRPVCLPSIINQPPARRQVHCGEDCEVWGLESISHVCPSPPGETCSSLQYDEALRSGAAVIAIAPLRMLPWRA
ncbi:hypothetical protein HaLaN_13972 [Haematococcus lacustris]|uniref:Uncharacterized protein n=1 Tax=Haematococcus lacustris TaxID=44745 RepID=A0A699ZEN9_HAELA|nr:hypothetical protein HaLaN_13972 [Haematococcus lacustris]